MPPRITERLLRDEGGAVTVDWIVLTAGLLIFGVMAGSSIVAGSTGMSEGVEQRLTEAEVPKVDFNAAD